MDLKENSSCIKQSDPLENVHHSISLSLDSSLSQVTNSSSVVNPSQAVEEDKSEGESTLFSPSLKSKAPAYKFKTVPALNFRCVHCKKVTTTDQALKKHLKTDHNINEDIPIGHYNSFIGQRRIKVPANTAPNPPEKTSEIFMCSMCDKEFQTKDGVSKHLKIFHNVHSLTNNLQSLGPRKIIPPNKEVSTFKSPFLHPVSSVQPCPGPTSSPLSTPSHVSFPKTSSKPTKQQRKGGKQKEIGKEKSVRGEEQQGEGRGAEKQQGGGGEELGGGKEQQGRGREQQASLTVNQRTPISEAKTTKPTKKKVKPQTFVEYCKSIVNPFCNGGVNVEKFSMWGKTEQAKSKAQEVSEAESNSLSSPEPNTINQVKLPESIQTNQNAAQSSTPPSNSIILTDVNLNNNGDSSLKSSSVPVPTNSAALGLRPKGKAVQKKRTRVCGTQDCVPCSVLVDCGVCRYCLNKSLK